jgi:hypothetical protein
MLTEVRLLLKGIPVNLLLRKVNQPRLSEKPGLTGEEGGHTLHAASEGYLGTQCATD